MGQTLTTGYNWVFGKKKIQIMMVGPFASGKTTLLYKLKLGEIVTTIPSSVGFNIEEIEHMNILFTIWDAAFRELYVNLWKHYYDNKQGFIVVVDSQNREDIAEAKCILGKMLEHGALNDAVMLVFANKQDLPDCMTPAEIADKLNLVELPTSHWHVLPASVKEGTGIYEGLEWLANVIARKESESL